MGRIPPTFHFVIRHKPGHLNKGADALTRRYIILSILDSRVLGFEAIKSLYPNDEDFKETYALCSKHLHSLYDQVQGFFFK